MRQSVERDLRTSDREATYRFWTCNDRRNLYPGAGKSNLHRCDQKVLCASRRESTAAVKILNPHGAQSRRLPDPRAGSGTVPNASRFGSSLRQSFVQSLGRYRCSRQGSDLLGLHRQPSERERGIGGAKTCGATVTRARGAEISATAAAIAAGCDVVNPGGLMVGLSVG